MIWNQSEEQMWILDQEAKGDSLRVKGSGHLADLPNRCQRVKLNLLSPHRCIEDESGAELLPG